MIRNSERNRIKPNENDEKEGNAVLNKGGKQFGLNKSTFMGNELKAKTNNKLEDLFAGNSQKKMVPLKRTESAVGLKHYSESKRQTIEKTFRRTEQESEWTPEGFDIDLSEFDSHVYDKKETMEEELVIPQRTFTVIENNNDDDTTVEYGPPKEIELPYEPESSCIVDVSNFTDYADESAYEIVRLLGKDLAEFSSLQDEDVLDTLAIQLYQDDEFDFDSDISELDTPYETDLQVPFSNHLFDVEHFLQCN